MPSFCPMVTQSRSRYDCTSSRPSSTSVKTSAAMLDTGQNNNVRASLRTPNTTIPVNLFFVRLRVEEARRLVDVRLARGSHHLL